MTNDPGTARIDIAICTRNRLPMLLDTITVLRKEMDAWPGARLLVADNGSSDGTWAALQALADEDTRIVPLSVPQTGLYHARIAVIAELRADILVFVDDDVLPEPGFLAVLAGFFNDPTVGIVGPAIMGLFDAPLPDWFPQRFLTWLPVTSDVPARQQCTYPVFPPGACIALRNAPCLAYFLAPQRRRVELGVGGGAILGQKVAYGEDTDLCEIYVRAGFQVLRTNAACVDHRVPIMRLTEAWILNRFRTEGYTRIRLARVRGKSVFERPARNMLAGLLILAPLRPFAGLLPRDWNIMLRAYLAKSLGAWAEVLQGRRDLRCPYPPDPLPPPDARNIKS